MLLFARQQLHGSHDLSAMRELLDLRGGARIFRYEWEGSVHNLTSKRLNDYVKLYLGDDFTAAHLTHQAIVRKDDAEDAGRRAGALTTWLARRPRRLGYRIGPG